MIKNPTSILSLYLSVISVLLVSTPLSAQKEKQSNQPPTPALTRMTPRHENFRLAYGGSTQDLDRLATVNTFVVDQDTNHVRILTTGTHDRAFMKSVAKGFPKTLIGLPWKIDYRIKVPLLTDLEISAGNGPITLSGVEGAIRVNAVESEASLQLTGGDVGVTIQRGTIKLGIPARSWHGLGADIKLASGNLIVGLQAGFSGDIDAQVLRTGEIDLTHAGLEPLGQNGISKRSVRARAGNGGATLTFTVGDGVIRIVSYLQG